jgi:hypothetical protein
MVVQMVLASNRAIRQVCIARTAHYVAARESVDVALQRFQADWAVPVVERILGQAKHMDPASSNAVRFPPI